MSTSPCPPGQRLRATFHAARTERPGEVGLTRPAGAAACNPVHSRLQPCAVQAATPWHPGCRRMCLRWNSPALSVSILAQFDVVGLTEMLDESLLLLADRAGLQHLGYSTLAVNNKPEHPVKAKVLLGELSSTQGLTLPRLFIQRLYLPRPYVLRLYFYRLCSRHCSRRSAARSVSLSRRSPLWAAPSTPPPWRARATSRAARRSSGATRSGRRTGGARRRASGVAQRSGRSPRSTRSLWCMWSGVLAQGARRIATSTLARRVSRPPRACGLVNSVPQARAGSALRESSCARCSIARRQTAPSMRTWCSRRRGRRRRRRALPSPPPAPFLFYSLHSSYPHPPPPLGAP